MPEVQLWTVQGAADTKQTLKSILKLQPAIPGRKATCRSSQLNIPVTVLDILAGIILPGAARNWTSVKCLTSETDSKVLEVTEVCIHKLLNPLGITTYILIHVIVQTFFLPSTRGLKSNKKEVPVCPSKTDGPGSIAQPLPLPRTLSKLRNHFIHFVNHRLSKTNCLQLFTIQAKTKYGFSYCHCHWHTGVLN